MKYARAIDALFALSSKGIRLGVGRMGEALTYRGDPQHGMAYVQIAGTNGKGSTATMVASVLQRAGYRTGLFTSPHLHRWVERIRVNGRPISEKEAGRRIGDVLAAFEQADAPETTFFELTTLMAIEAFRDHRCDVAVLEVGLGGRLDATTALTPKVTAITRVALDHTGILGNSLTGIAQEKAGIIKPGVPVVVGVAEADTQRVVLDRAREVGAPSLCVARDFDVTAEGNRRFSVRVGARTFSDLTLGLRGPHQRHNAACAAAVLCELERVTDIQATAALDDGLRRVSWPGRVERLGRKPLVVVDAAHNVDGCLALASYLSDVKVSGNKVLVFGCMVDKDVRPMLQTLAPHFDHIIYPPAAMPRAASPSDLCQVQSGRSAASVEAALAAAHDHAAQDGLIVVAGSIFVVAAFRAKILGVRTDPQIRM